MTAPSRRFGREARLGSRLDFQRVFREGRKTPAGAVVVWSRVSGDGAARLGLSVGAKVGTAPRRNRLKRLTRETFRLHRERLVPGADVVVNLRPGCAWKTRRDAERDLLDAWRRAGLVS